MIFKNAKFNSAFDSSIFSDTRTADSSDHHFDVLGTVGSSDKGTYELFYNVLLERYLSVNTAVSETFYVEILDACDAPNGIVTPAELDTNLVYTVT